VIVRTIALAAFAFAAAGAGAAEVIPPAPAAHFNDYASLVGPATATRLDQELDQFERDSSNQVVVAIYPTMQSDSSIEDYTVRVAQAWHAGLKGRDNGAILFIFVRTHQLFIQAGYGLEARLTDATCKQIIEDDIAPAFKKGDYDGGVAAGVEAILAAARGEYQGTGRTVGEARAQHSSGLWTFAILAIILIAMSYIRRQACVYNGRRRSGFGSGMLAGMLIGGARGGFGGGGGGFGGGGFSGGGGGFGGGGAGGSW
jgi:uncharacterized protein